MNKSEDNISPKKTTEILTQDLYFARVSYSDKYLVKVIILKNTEFGIKELACLRETVNSLTNKKPYAYLFYTEKGVTYSMEMFQHAKLTEKDHPVIATAIVLNNLALKLAANFYFNFYKPRNPYRVFTNLTEARKWVMGFKSCK